MQNGDFLSDDEDDDEDHHDDDDINDNCNCKDDHNNHNKGDHNEDDQDNQEDLNRDFPEMDHTELHQEMDPSQLLLCVNRPLSCILDHQPPQDRSAFEIAGNFLVILLSLPASAGRDRLFPGRARPSISS